MDTVASVLGATSHWDGGGDDGVACDDRGSCADPSDVWRVLLHGKVGRRGVKGGPLVGDGVTEEQQQQEQKEGEQKEQEQECKEEDGEQQQANGRHDATGSGHADATQEHPCSDAPHSPTATHSEAHAGECDAVDIHDDKHGGDIAPAAPSTPASSPAAAAFSAASAPATSSPSGGLLPTTPAAASTLDRPFLYSLPPKDTKALHSSEGLNARASWLAGTEGFGWRMVDGCKMVGCAVTRGCCACVVWRLLS